ncbi:thioredoxin [Mesoplasma photuris]|uniref:thioredoxin n=1 Tax=Mesoplasma photuris TaxID=217731 RepID=UPI0004E23822|nr:thioredoxin [Mesoplasma photuris]
MSRVIEITSKAQFDELIKKGKTFVDFKAEWCGPCKMLAPIIDDLSGKMTDVQFLAVDVDKIQELTVEYQIMSMPTMMMFENGTVVRKTIGFMGPAPLAEFIQK